MKIFSLNKQNTDALGGFINYPLIINKETSKINFNLTESDKSDV